MSFLDFNCLNRVAGHLKNSILNVTTQNPLLLPSNHHFTYLVINQCHISHFHVGPDGGLSFLRTKFLIVRGHSTLRKVVRKSITCLKVSSKASQQILADMPRANLSCYPLKSTL